jgi:hypothetical protein
MQRKDKIARLPLPLRTQINLRLAAQQDGAELLAWLNAIPGLPDLLAAEFAGEPVSQQNLDEWRQGGFREWYAQREMFDEARELAADAGPVAGNPSHELTEHLAAALAAKFAGLLAGWDGTEDPAFDAKLRVLTKFNQNLTLLRRMNHSATRLRMEQAPFEREEQRLAAAAAYEAERSKERQQVFEQMMARKRAADQLAAETSAAAAHPETRPTGSARSSTPGAPAPASTPQNQNPNQNHNPTTVRPRVT